MKPKIAKYWEMSYPFIFAFILAVMVYLSNFDLQLKNLGSMLSSLINIGAILIGFLATMISILITVTGRKIMAKIRECGAIDLLSHYFFVSIISGFIVIVLSTVINALLDLTGPISHVIFTIWVFVCTYFLLTAYRIVYLILGILKNIMAEDEKKKDEHKLIAKAENAWNKK